MIDIRLLRTEPEKVKAALARRKENVDIDGLLELDKLRRELTFDADKKKAEQKAAQNAFEKMVL